MPTKTKPIAIPSEFTEAYTTVNEIRSLAGAVASGMTQGKDKRWVGDRLELIELKLKALKEEL